MTPAMQYFGKAKLWRQLKDQWLSGAQGEERREKQVQLKDCIGCKIILYDIVLQDTRHLSFLYLQKPVWKTQSMKTNVKDGLKLK